MKKLLKKNIQKNRYPFVVVTIFLVLFSFFVYKQFAPKPTTINLIGNDSEGNSMSVRILGNNVWVKGDQIVTKNTEGAVWVAPGTYAGMPCNPNQGTPCALGMSISGHFFTWGVYGELDNSRSTQNIDRARSFTQRVYRAAGCKETTPCNENEIDFYYYSSSSNQCKALTESPNLSTTYCPNQKCSVELARCNRLLNDVNNNQTSQLNQSRFSPPIEPNTGICYASLSDCQQYYP